MSAVVRVRLRASGRVQGVGFRWFVRELARELGLAGWVRNDPDGSVLLEAEGSADAIDRLRADVARGPQAARVDSLGAEPAGTEPLPRPFGVHR